MKDKHRTIIEPFKIKTVEPLVLMTRRQREPILRATGYNLFLVAAKHVTFDFLTDSGTTAMSAAQWGAMLVADESYAGSRSFERFERVVRELTGYAHVIPTHQGRAAERILFSHLVRPGCKVPSNNHFDTTRANIEQLGGEAVDLVIAEGRDPRCEHPFKGNIDLERLETFCAAHRQNIPCGMMTITNNTGGGQPVSMENLRGAAEIYHRYDIPFILDACRFAENSFFIKLREPGFAEQDVRRIARATFELADGCMMSAKKDGLVNIGGFIALRDSRWVDHLRNQLILTEGFPTYGGMAARDLEAIAVGLEEVLDEHYLDYRLAVSRYMAAGLNRLGVPTVQPAGGHAVYIDAKAFLPHIPPEQYPGQALVCELYLAEGIRSCEIGSVMFGRDVDGRFQPAAMELVRLAFPRRVYTQSHFDYILEGMESLVARKSRLHGLRMTHRPPFLPHFTAQFEPVETTTRRVDEPHDEHGPTEAKRRTTAGTRGSGCGLQR
ncbi:MAG TPA: tryptophanase [Thermoguttaceae bacterium]|nr:tryptophanase [Thermoguttaceae bacterium]